MTGLLTVLPALGRRIASAARAVWSGAARAVARALSALRDAGSGLAGALGRASRALGRRVGSLRLPRFLRRNALLAGGAAVLLVVGGAGVAWAASQGGTEYVTAVAGTGDVEEELTFTGTISSATRSDAAFGVSGTVATVEVEVGDVVEAGDVLAALDRDDLESQVDAAEAAVARAEQTLEDDLASQTTTTTTSTPTTTTAPATTAIDLSAEIAAVEAAQQGLLALMTTADGLLATSAQSEADAQVACADFLASDLVTDPNLDQPTLAAIQVLATSCQTAISGTTTAQQATKDAQDAVSAQMAALDQAVADLQAAASAPTGGSAPGGGSSTPGTSSATTSESTFGATSGGPASAAAIAADRAAITAAEADLEVAKADLKAAKLTSPIAGTVAQVGFDIGDAVSAGSSTQVVSVIGDDGYVVEVSVGLDDLQKLEPGQEGLATLPVSGKQYPASVASVGFVDVSTGSTPQYTVVLVVDAGDDVLRNGAAAEVEITVATVSDVLVIPISALHRGEDSDTVDVLVEGVPVTRVVEGGAMGTEYVEIASGLDEGDIVVIADPSQPIVSDSDTSSDGGLTGLTGGSDTGGGGFPAGEGFPDGVPVPGGGGLPGGGGFPSG